MKSSYDHSDTGNAELLNDLFGNDIRYDSVSQRWLQWKQGHRWYELEPSEQVKLAIKTADYRIDLAKDSSLEATRAKAEFAFAIRSRDEYKIKAMLSLARHLPPIGNVGIQWDSKHNYLAVANGVVNLTTGNLRPGVRNDYISQGIDLPYISGTRAPVWEKFISDICCGDQQLIEYLQRAIGYTLTGFTIEQVFFLLHGGGSNGKSVLTNILGELLRGFAKTVRFSAFEESKNESSRRDLADLPGVRAVFASEGAAVRAIDTTVIKDITGATPITTRRLYSHPFTFTPRFKLWLTTNQLPKISDDSLGFWRRVIIIPFNATFEGINRDNYMQAKLESELPGILAWAVAGAVRWNSEKLNTPNELLYLTKKYQRSEDIVEQFIDACCVRDELVSARSGQLYETYKSWAHESGLEIMSTTAFGRRMGAKFQREHDNSGWYYLGIKPKNTNFSVL